MPRIRFGEFELDEQTLELRHKGSPIRIQQQPARVLAFLLNHHGKLVTRQQIQEAIWGSGTFVDFEQNLNFCIRQVRITLNEQAEKPLFIETLPRLGYRFIGPVERFADGETRIPQKRIRIGILPFENLGGSVEDYFVLGLTDDMISALSRIDPLRLRVTLGPRMQGGALAKEELERLQREFNLDYLLRGSIRRSAGAVRISAQLFDLGDKNVLWSEVYDRKLSDLLAMQEEVATRVSHSLALELLQGGAVGSRQYARSTEAYDAYLRGRYFWHQMTRDAVRRSIDCFNQALEIDRNFAPAHAGLADCYAQMGSNRLGMMKPFVALEKARNHLERAMELDETMAEAHCTSGLIKSWYDFDWDGSERSFQVALSLDPGNITALLWRTMYLNLLGRHQDAIDSVLRAKEVEPLSPVVNAYLGVTQANSGQYDLAIRQLNQAIELNPHYFRSFMFLGRALDGAGRYQEAIEAFQRALSINPHSVESLGMLGGSMACAGDRAGALGVLERLMAAESPMEPASQVAYTYGCLGDSSQMFLWLEKAVERKSTSLYNVLFSEHIRQFHSDPRYHAFLSAVGLAHLAKH
jgi:TolB-like protein